METMNVFLNRMFVVFLARVSPDSRVAKPRCMMNTRPAAIIIHRLLAVNIASPTPPSWAAAGPPEARTSSPASSTLSIQRNFLLMMSHLLGRPQLHKGTFLDFRSLEAETMPTRGMAWKSEKEDTYGRSPEKGLS